ncbi:MAG: 6-phosphogluconolactonase [Chitinophagaceae bacterium]|nr:6-phosphogluconolactonase [Chitinophagaceae bacterium]
MQLHILKDAAEVNTALADFFVRVCSKAIKEKGHADVVLSGGNSPKSLHELLASEYKDKLEWNKINFFFGDERYVPFDSPDNNGAMAKRTLFDPLNISDKNVFYIDTSLKPEVSAKKYASEILKHFGDDPVSFDLIILGLGDNVHTASLFPNTDVLDEKKALVKNVYVDEIKAMRITMTAALINESAHIAFLVYGASKAEAVYNAIEGEKNYKLYPAQLIEPEIGETDWFLDEAAAAKLSKK